eukprot:GFUD01034065.1.p1 GENE.GFUD01034065.1~~GFUD01034065.1.p1  ORF type:complete len:213 (-),score=45.96 GFUD01034065.1:133-771(-)
MKFLFLLYSLYSPTIAVFNKGPPFYDVSSDFMYHQELVGLYCKTDNTTTYNHKSWAIYQKQTGNMFLYLTAGYWRFSEDTSNVNAKVKKYYNYEYPHFITWNEITVNQIWHNSSYEEKCANTELEASTWNVVVICSVVGGTVFILVFALLIAIVIIRTKKASSVTNTEAEQTNETRNNVGVKRKEDCDYEGEEYYSRLEREGTDHYDTYYDE